MLLLMWVQLLLIRVQLLVLAQWLWVRIVLPKALMLLHSDKNQKLLVKIL